MADEASSSLTAASAEERFRSIFAECIAQGMSPNEAAAHALRILAGNDASVTASQEEGEDAEMVNTSTEANSVQESGGGEETSASAAVEEHSGDTTSATMSNPPPSAVVASKHGTASDNTPELTFADISNLVEAAKETEVFTHVIRAVGKVFSDPDLLSKAACVTNKDHATESQSHDELVNIESVQEMYQALRRGTSEGVENSLKNALKVLATTLERESQFNHSNDVSRARPYLVALEYPDIQYGDPDLQGTMFSLCKGFVRLPVPVLEAFVGWLELQTRDYFVSLLESLQMFVTIKMLRGISGFRDVGPAVKMMHILNHVNERKSFVPFEEFYNAAVSEQATDDHTFLTYDYETWHNDLVEHKSSETRLATSTAALNAALAEAGHGQPSNNDVVENMDDKDLPTTVADHSNHASVLPARSISDSFCAFPFILDPGSKAHIVRIDAIQSQRREFRNARRGMEIPYLVLQVRREDLVTDALNLINQYSPGDFKKPLKVKFVGEDGVDEGGVQKEFFLLMTRQLLDPSFSMFTQDESSRTMWFNPNTFEGTMKFELVGILLGLAIYNGIILDVSFPTVLYKKLLGIQPTLEDLKQAFPELGTGLEQLLQYEPADQVESVFGLSFEVSVEVFGEVKVEELKPGGSGIPVTGDNRAEYVDLYLKYRLVDSVSKQYDAFHKGFHMVCGGEPLEMFKPQELELLICGSAVLDFEELERTTRYEDYTENDSVVRNFWTVVHNLDGERKKRLLMFMTGSDRVPIRGLAALRLTISKNGPDSDRLPTAHTCFNHLLLPAYDSLEKLRDRLIIAVDLGAEGFGSA